MGKTLTAITLCVLLGACSTTRTGSFCPIGPLLPDAGATTRWTEGEKDYAIVLNETGEKECGWKAP